MRSPSPECYNDILDDDHIQWHPPLIGHYTNFWPLLIWTLLPNLTFYLIVQGFHRTYATGAACQQRTLTPPDTWSCPTLGLACVLMSRPISPELVLSPDFWISNTPRYFSFASDVPVPCRGRLGTLKTPSCPWRGCPAAGQNLETGHLSRHYIAEISLNVTLNHNQQQQQQLIRNGTFVVWKLQSSCLS